MIPFGILEVQSGQLHVTYGSSSETSDFIVDSLEIWWRSKGSETENIKTLAINLDNGPQCSSVRTQFIKRMKDFANKFQIDIQLIYYPPYHSKYNPIERCWGVLEMHWNGAMLDSIHKVLEWTKTMTWKGIHPVVRLLEDHYEKGITIKKKLFKKIEQKLKRHPFLPKYSVLITHE